MVGFNWNRTVIVMILRGIEIRSGKVGRGGSGRNLFIPLPLVPFLRPGSSRGSKRGSLCFAASGGSGRNLFLFHRDKGRVETRLGITSVVVDSSFGISEIIYPFGNLIFD